MIGLLVYWLIRCLLKWGPGLPFATLQDLVIHRNAERYSDRLYVLVLKWRKFDIDTVGNQLVRAADSVGANIAESFGRYHYAERIHFLYYARGSAYESVYWVRRARQRNLLPIETAEKIIVLYTELIASLNSFIRQMKQRRSAPTKVARSVPRVAEERELYLSSADVLEDNPF